MGRRVLITEDKHLFNRCWGDLWKLPENDKKLRLG